MSIQRARAALPVMFGGGASAPYIETAAALLDVAFWGLRETSGTAVIEDNNSYNGTYSNVTLDDTAAPDGAYTAPSFNGTSSVANVYSAGLSSAFDGQEITLAGWLRVSAAGVWTDGALRYAAYFRETSANVDTITVIKQIDSNTLRALYRAGGVNNVIDHTISDTDWVHAAITASLAADEFKFYVNGSQVGSTITGLGTFGTSALETTRANLGSILSSGFNEWSGWLYAWGIASSALSADDISTLANP